MRIYRIECSDGLGPYNSADRDTKAEFSKLIYETFDVESILKKHPAPYSDNRLKINLVKRRVFLFKERTNFPQNYFCAFANLGQFRRWLASQSFVEKIAKLDIKLVVYEIKKTDVVIGDYQCVFEKEKARQIRAVSFSEIDLNAKKKCKISKTKGSKK